MNITIDSKDYFKIFLMFLTILVVSGYGYVYFISKTKYGDKYLPLLTTGRALILSGFLIYFYNPLRTKFEYGPSMPFFAFSAGISLFFLLKRYDILNLVHFLLYGELLPEDPSLKACSLAESKNPGLEIFKKD
jgi:hypothetical protein